MDFYFPEAVLMSLHQGVGLGQCLEAVCRVAQMVTDLRQYGAIVGNVQGRPGGLAGGDPLAELAQSRLRIALHSQCPATQARSPGCPLGKSLLSRERDRGLGMLVHGRHVPAPLRDQSHQTPCKCQTWGMR